jgi:hypothetical protein
MYYDLNVPWTSRDADLQRKISFLADCRYIHHNTDGLGLNLISKSRI